LAACEIERDARGRIEASMVRRADVLFAADILGPLPLPWIERAGQQEPLLRMAARGAEKQFVEPGLAAGGVGSHVAKITTEIGTGLDAVIIVRINTAVERARDGGTVVLFELGQSASSGEREHEVKLRKLVTRQILHIAA